MSSSVTTVQVDQSPVYLDATVIRTPATVVAVPGGGGSVEVSFSTTPNASVLGASATWIVWDEGTVTVPTSMTLCSPVQGLRVVVATAAGKLEITG